MRTQMYNSSIIGLHDKPGEPSVNENIKKMEFTLTLNATDVQGQCVPNNPSLLRHPHLGAENLQP